MAEAGLKGPANEVDRRVMADLSDLLGDVYGDSRDDGPPVRREPPADERGASTPDWAADARLDAAFADWSPGPPADAPAAEREMADAGMRLEPVAPSPDRPDDVPAGVSRPLPADLAEALSAALVQAPPVQIRPPGESPEAEAPSRPAPTPFGVLASHRPFQPLPEVPTDVDEDDAVELHAVASEALSTEAATAEVMAIADPPDDDPFEGAAPAMGTGVWERSDDDILPAHGLATARGGIRLSLSLRRR